jgi:tubulin--tyrosine ligase-like protein 12
MILQLREVPGLAERMAALMCVDLDRKIEADEQDDDESGSLEHVSQVVEKERARVQERSDSTAWLELEELGIDDDMLVALDLSANFPV